MRGPVLAEQAHFVNLIPPIDITGGVTGDVFKMDKWTKACIVIQIGVSAAAFTKIIVNACSSFAAANPEAIPYSLYVEETALGDTLSSRESVLATGRTPVAADNIMYVIEIDAMELPDGKPYVQLSLTNGTNSVIASAIAILSGGRYTAAGDSQTAIA